MGSSGINRRTRIKCSSNICKSDGLFNTFLYCFLICLLVMTIVGYTQTKVPKENENKANSTITDEVFLKCTIHITDSDEHKLDNTYDRLLFVQCQTRNKS